MIAVIDYNAGNTQSVLFAMERIGADVKLTADAGEIRSADKVIFPGVGEASTTMQYLREKGLDELIPSLRQPVLGICLGLQLMCRHSEENDTDCLGIFDVDVKQFDTSKGIKVPQMGWNKISKLKTPLFVDNQEDEYAYFVHSFYAEMSKWTIAVTTHDVSFSSGLCKENFYATQFHPEKSGDVGERILKSFIRL